MRCSGFIKFCLECKIVDKAIRDITNAPIKGVGELDEEKLPDLLTLKYHTLNDAVRELGDAETIRQTFVGFQRYLYQGSA